MEETQKNKGGVYQQWHGTILENYIPIMGIEIKKLVSLPTSEFYISGGDIDDLIEVAEFFEVEIPEDADLKDILTFKKYLGKIKNKAKKTILEDLRPTDPYAEGLQKLADYDIRQMEGESV